ncbi:hypothetical protein GEV33_007006 [Tenebrio molitor]|uniref:Uncharacterized protein n=1 Tax=Tenebrio molitor TaxID=7067 RepID=A0A8J6HBI8_TENMO|nr:hypothetical protein GEV33_007006 [Tenebrio molitor]
MEKVYIGRERDPENSEVAQLIRQSLQADKEREERRQKALETEQQSDASTVQLTACQNATILLAGVGALRDPTIARGKIRSLLEYLELADNARHMTTRRAHPAGTRSATAERAAVPQVAESELRTWDRDPQSSPRADCRSPWCLSSGAARLRGRRGARRVYRYRYRLPITDIDRPLAIQRDRGVVRSSYRTVPGKASFLQFSIVISLMVHFVRTRQDHAVRLVSQA